MTPAKRGAARDLQPLGCPGDAQAIDQHLALVEPALAATQPGQRCARQRVERLAATPGTGAYGIPSVKLSLWATATVVARIPATVFIPQPRVESVMVRITRRDVPAVDVDHDALMDLVRTAFGQRRKMLRRSLAAKVTPEQFATAGIDPSERPERLGVEQWGALTAALLAGT